MASSKKPLARLGFHETMALTRLADTKSASGEPVQNFISHTPAWKPGQELPWESLNIPASLGRRSLGPGAFGGHVYVQAPFAAGRVVGEEDAASAEGGRRSIHSIQGVFTSPGLIDRPYIYNVSTVSSSRSFTTRAVTARQPKQASSKPLGPFPVSDADLDLNSVCFTCLVTFKKPITPSPSDLQLTPSAQERYAAILSQRAPDEWDPSPQADIDAIRDMFPSTGHGMFPILDMYKVDMREYNKDKLVPDKRELILYRLIRPLPEDDLDAHALCHAYETDRNNLITLGNHLGYGYSLGTAASLSYSFYVHVNAEEAVMRGDGWWLQEMSWPRISAGRGMIESKTWSPEGKHVASGYQDGLVLPSKGKAKISKAPKL